MKVLVWAGGVVVLAIGVFAIWSGLTQGQGQATAEAFGSALGSLGGWGRSLMGGLGRVGVAGNAALAAAIAAIGFIAVQALVPGARTGRNFPVALVVFALLGVVLYQPGIVGA